MLNNIKPNRPKSRDGALTPEEKPLVKGLLNAGYIPQDIVHIVNQGRKNTVNPGRIAEVKQDTNITPASENKVLEFIKIQSSYDPKTLLNPYKDIRLIRAREAMIAAVQVFNSPTITFKTESFCVLANIAWTYLLHEKMEQTTKGSTVLDNKGSITVSGTIKRQDICPIKNKAVIANLEKIIEIRDAAEHTLFVFDEGECFGALFQACCINFEHYLTKWFGKNLSMTKELSLALQFVRLEKDQCVEFEKGNLPKKIKAITRSIEESAFVDDNAFQLKIHYTSEATSITNADLHKLVDYDKTESSQTEVVKKVARVKLTESEIIKRVKDSGYNNFTRTDHQNFWKQRWASATIRNLKAHRIYGELFNGWGWYEDKWLPEVLEHCEKNKEKYTKPKKPQAPFLQAV